VYKHVQHQQEYKNITVFKIVIKIMHFIKEYGKVQDGKKYAKNHVVI